MTGFQSKAEEVASALTQDFVSHLMQVEEMLDIEMPLIEVELETEDATWKVTVSKEVKNL